MANKNLQNGFIIGKALGGVNVVTPQLVLDSLIATENRRYTPESGVDGFDEVVVNVPIPPTPSAYEYNITFMANGTEWAKIGVNGEGKIAEPPQPTPPQEHSIFGGWYDGDTKISFPYTPTEDKTFVAQFGDRHVEIEISNAGGLICTDNNTEYIKTNDGLAIAGYFYYLSSSTTYTYLMLVSKTVTATAFTNSGTPQSFEYDGETYYRASYTAFTGKKFFTDGIPPHKISDEYLPVGSATDIANNAKMLLDYYYSKTN